MLSILGTDFIACWACAEMFKSRISRPNRIRFSKSRVTGPWDHKVSVSAKKVKKKFHACVPLTRVIAVYEYPQNIMTEVKLANLRFFMLTLHCYEIWSQLVIYLQSWSTNSFFWFRYPIVRKIESLIRFPIIFRICRSDIPVE
jgi:hypothetical protein